MVAALSLCLLSFVPREHAVLLRHSPHDTVAGLAACVLPDGRVEVVVVADDRLVLSSRDGCMTFLLVSASGLDRTQALAVTFNPSVAWTGVPGQNGVFLIGTQAGVWLYEPDDPAGTGAVSELSGGLPAGGGSSIFAMASPDGAASGFQPSFLLAETGAVYRQLPNRAGWALVLDTAQTASTGAVVLAPGFDAASSGPRATVFVAVNGRLYRSEAGGGTGTWTLVHDLAASLGAEWRIASLALDPDYGSFPSARVYVGTVRPPSGSVLEEGQILSSLDRGASFTTGWVLGTGVFALAAAPPGPSHGAAVFAAGRLYPGVGGYTGTGILRSYDRGASWDDAGSWQCFLLENHPGDSSGSKALRNRQQLLALPGYAQSGRILYGRHEGLFWSEDEGRLFIEMPLRSSSETNSVAVARRASGGLQAFGATYGGGLAVKDLATGAEVQAPPGMTTVYQQSAAASPDFARDGAVYAGGTPRIVAWFDPAVDPPVNAFGRTGAFLLPLEHYQTSASFVGYVRHLALSPQFSAAVGGADQVMYFSSYADQVYVSLDGGQTYREANASASGKLPYFTGLALAPTFSAGPVHNDVFACSNDGTLWRVTNSVWYRVLDLGVPVVALAVDPTFHPVNNRRLFLALDNGHGVAEVEDLPGGAIGRRLNNGLPQVRLVDVAAVASGASVWLYAASLGSGVYRAAHGAQTLWSPLVDQGYPRTAAGCLAFSPSWPSDGLVFLGAGDGAYQVADGQPQASWSRVFAGTVLDDASGALTTFVGPAGPAPDPGLPWPWIRYASWKIPGRPAVGEKVLVATYDGSRLAARGYARRVAVHTFAGTSAPQPLGALELSVVSLENGAPLGQVTVDLGAVPGSAAPYTVVLDLPVAGPVPVSVEVGARLGAGEILPVDAVTLWR